MCTSSKTCVHSSKNIRAHFTFSSNLLGHTSTLRENMCTLRFLIKFIRIYVHAFQKHMCTLYIGHGLYLYQRCSIPETTKQLLLILSKTTSKHIFIIITCMHTSFLDFISTSNTYAHHFIDFIPAIKHICTLSLMLTYLHTYETPYI